MTLKGDDLLTFDVDMSGYPGKHSPILLDTEEVLAFAFRSKNHDHEWEIRGYKILADRVCLVAVDPRRADMAVVLVRTFDPDSLTEDGKYRQQTAIRHGVPVSVAVDGKPAIAAWLYVVREMDHGEIAEVMGVGRRTVTEYLYRFRQRAPGLPGDVDVPPVGSILPEIPENLRPG